MGLDALGIWVLISVLSPGEIITVSETEEACLVAHDVYTTALDPEYDPDASWSKYGGGINPEISDLAECVFIPHHALTPPQDL